MAEAITYADLRFVKVPLKNSISSHLGQDCEDEELTYENVQVSPVPGGPSGLASPALVEKAGVRSQQPTASRSSVKSPPAIGRIPRCSVVCLQYFLLGLLLACLTLGVAAICLGVRYLQLSQQLRQVTRIWEATNSSLQDQLREKTSKLEQKEMDLQKSQRELNLSQDDLLEKQKIHEGTEQQLQACQSEGERTRKNLENEQQQKTALSKRLINIQEKLRNFLSCSSDACCPLGWIREQNSCFYISRTSGDWESSNSHCKSLSSQLAAFSREPDMYSYQQVSLPSGLKQLLDDKTSYWIQDTRRTSQNPPHSHSYCLKIEKYSRDKYLWRRTSSWCTELYAFICESGAFRFPDDQPH